MEVAYDVIQESAVPVEQPNESRPAEVVLSAELQQAYKTFSSSAWGKGFSSFLGNVKRQSEEIYEGLTKEVNEVQKEAASELGLLREGIFGRVRGLSLTAGQQTEARADKDDPNALAARDAAAGGPSADDPSPTAGGSGARIETSQLISRFKSEAAKRLLELQKAEDAADEALFRLGSNLATFLGKTVTKVSSQDGADNHNDSQLLFESHDPNSGRRHIHTSRLEAQLHALHTNAATFTQDPCGSSEWNTWAENFDVETKTGDIARDLDRFPELREMLERLTGPSTTDEAKEKVEYSEFWRRYYFVRGIVETGDQKRREMLKGRSLQPRFRHPNC